MGIIGDAYDFQVGFRLRQLGSFNIDSVDVINFLDIVFDDIEVGLSCNFVSDNYDTSCV